MDSKQCWGMGVDKSGGETCVSICRKDDVGIVTIMAVLYGDVAEYIADLYFNQFRLLDVARAAEKLPTTMPDWQGHWAICPYCNRRSKHGHLERCELVPLLIALKKVENLL